VALVFSPEKKAKNAFRSDLRRIRPNFFDPQNVNPMIFIAQINTAAPVDEHVFGLRG
jgi:hypothetical protein